MVLVQIWPFFLPLFQAILVRKMAFTIFLNEKTPFLAIKTRSYKCRKMEVFPKGLTHGLVQIWPFSNLFLKAILVRKMTFTIIQNEKAPFQAIKTRSSKSRKIDIFAKGLVNAWFQSKYGHFSNPFFQAIFVRKMTFTIFQNEKTPFFAIKTRSSECRKIEVFPKGLTHGFGANMAIFPTFFFRQYWLGK